MICIDHAASRIAEKLINITLGLIMEMYSTQPEEAIARVKNFCYNLAERDVHQAHRIEIVQGKLKVSIQIFCHPIKFRMIVLFKLKLAIIFIVYPPHCLGRRN